MFSSKKSITLDEKNRLRIPSTYAAALGKEYCITKGVGGCLYVMSKSFYETFSRPFKNIPFSDVAGRKISRAFFSGVDIPQEDNQGRFVISQLQRDFAGIDKKVVFVGNGDILEIWSEENYEAQGLDSDAQEMDRIYSEMNKYGL